MREIERRYKINPRGRLQRGASGSLKPGGEESDIADIWAEQRRIRLAEAIAADKAKAARKQRRKERGLLGWRKVKGRAEPSGSHMSSPNTLPQHPLTKEIEIKISLPKIRVGRLLRRAKRLVPRLSRQQWLWVGAAIVVLVVSGATKSIYHHGTNAEHPGASSTTRAIMVAPKGGDRPQFNTVLPKGKTIDQLGGWGRVSPPDKDPVFGYSDTLSGQHIVVSEQPLPDSFLGDTSGRLAQLAKQLSANQQVTTADSTVAYIGLSNSGSQSVVTTKQGLLILMRSADPIDNRAWTEYITTLQ